MISKKPGLSKREKVLIVAVLVLLAVVGSVFFIVIPTNDAYTQAQMELDALTVQHQSILVQLAQIEPVAEENTSLLERLANYRERYAVFAHTENLEGVFTHALLAFGITPGSLFMEDTSADYGLREFLVRINAAAPAVQNILLFSDFINDMYSFRLTSMRISGIAGEEVSADFVIETRLVE